MKALLLGLLLAATTNAYGYFACYEGTSELVWFIGDPWKGFIPGISLDDTLVCSATGAELEFIQASFTGLRFRLPTDPPPSARSKTTGGVTQNIWRAEDAIFIVTNMPPVPEKE